MHKYTDIGTNHIADAYRRHVNNVAELADRGNFAVYNYIRANKILVLPFKLIFTNRLDGKFITSLGICQFNRQIHLIRAEPGKLISDYRLDGCKRRTVVDKRAVLETERNIKRFTDKTVIGAVGLTARKKPYFAVHLSEHRLHGIIGVCRIGKGDHRLRIVTYAAKTTKHEV